MPPDTIIPRVSPLHQHSTSAAGPSAVPSSHTAAAGGSARTGPSPALRFALDAIPGQAVAAQARDAPASHAALFREGFEISYRGGMRNFWFSELHNHAPANLESIAELIAAADATLEKYAPEAGEWRAREQAPRIVFDREVGHNYPRMARYFSVSDAVLADLARRPAATDFVLRNILGDMHVPRPETRAVHLFREAMRSGRVVPRMLRFVDPLFDLRRFLDRTRENPASIRIFSGGSSHSLGHRANQRVNYYPWNTTSFNPTPQAYQSKVFNATSQGDMYAGFARGHGASPDDVALMHSEFLANPFCQRERIAGHFNEHGFVMYEVPLRDGLNVSFIAPESMLASVQAFAAKHPGRVTVFCKGLDGCPQPAGFPKLYRELVRRLRSEAGVARVLVGTAPTRSRDLALVTEAVRGGLDASRRPAGPPEVALYKGWGAVPDSQTEKKIAAREYREGVIAEFLASFASAQPPLGDDDARRFQGAMALHKVTPKFMNFAEPKRADMRRFLTGTEPFAVASVDLVHAVGAWLRERGFAMPWAARAEAVSRAAGTGGLDGMELAEDLGVRTIFVAQSELWTREMTAERFREHYNDEGLAVMEIPWHVDDAAAGGDGILVSVLAPASALPVLQQFAAAHPQVRLYCAGIAGCAPLDSGHRPDLGTDREL
ncbi:hypothetical protein [Ramlibacter sp.]|uniref:hypothetical protein n=1 Tax=Ramlibacter sp. TaxID=1917967 RepID=UPI003D0DB818